jgi:hypothetical protein
MLPKSMAGYGGNSFKRFDVVELDYDHRRHVMAFWRTIVSQIRMLNFPVRMRLDVRDDDPDPVLSCKLDLRDRTTGERIELDMVAALPSWIVDKAQALHIVRTHLINCMTHEIDEALHFDGTRVFDPHKVRKIEITITQGER